MTENNPSGGAQGQNLSLDAVSQAHSTALLLRLGFDGVILEANLAASVAGARGVDLGAGGSIHSSA